MLKTSKQKRVTVGILALSILLIFVFLMQWIPKKEPDAASTTKVYLSNLSSLAFKTKSKGTKHCYVFGLGKVNKYGVAPAMYCLNLGEKAYSGTVIKEITDKVKKEAAAAMRWGYQKNNLEGGLKEKEDIRNKNLLKYVYKTDCTENEFRYATQLAVWMMLDAKQSLHGYEPADSKNKLYVLAKQIVKMAKTDIGKGSEDVGPRAIQAKNPSKTEFVPSGTKKKKVGPYSYETSVYGYPYLVSVVKDKKSEKDEFYTGEFPKGFQMKSDTATFIAATKWNMEMSTKEERQEKNKNELSKFIKSTLRSGAVVNGKYKKGQSFTIYVDNDADMKLTEEVAKHIRIFVEGLPEPSEEKQYFYNTKLNYYQRFGRVSSVQGVASSPIELDIKPGGAQLKLFKYPSDAKFSDDFSLFDNDDPQAWSDHNNDRLENDPDVILEQKLSDAVMQNTSALLANQEFLQAFDEYKNAIAFGDTQKQEQLSGKFRPLLFYAQNDPEHDDLSEVLEAYHDTLRLEAEQEFNQTGTVTEPLFTAIYAEYAANQDEGAAQVRIDATFVVRGPKGAFADTKYAEDAVTEGSYSYLTVKSKNGKVTITGVKTGTYVIAEKSVALDNYRLDGFSKLYKNINSQKSIQDAKETKAFTYKGKDYTGIVVEIKESATEKLNYYDYIKIDYPYGTLEVEKNAKPAAPGGEALPCDAAFRLVGISEKASYRMRNGNADDPMADGGHNFMTESGHARVTKLRPGDYVLYEYRKGQSFRDEDGNACQMPPGYEEYDTNPASDPGKLLEVYRFTVKDGKEATSVSFMAHVENLPTPTVAFVKLDGEEYEAYKNYETDAEIRQELLTHFADSKSFLNRIEVSFRVTGISEHASYPEGKLFETQDNVCLVTDLMPGTYQIQEEAILSTDGAEYDVNGKKYEIELTREHTLDNPYLIVHPNYIENPIYADLVLNKTDNYSIPLSEVTFSCASYPGEYTKGYTDNELSQKNPENRYTGKEYYAEGTVKNGVVSFENIRVEVDGDNNVTTWVHLHELKGRAGYEPVPIQPDGAKWNDYAQQCPYCKMTGQEDANGYDLPLTDIKAFPKVKGRKTITVINKRTETDTATLAIHKTTPGGFLNITGAAFDLYTDPALGTGEKIPLGRIEDPETGEFTVTTLDPADTTTERVQLVTGADGQAAVKITKPWLEAGSRFVVKETYVPEPYVIETVETSATLRLGDFVVLSIENRAKEDAPGKIVIKKVAAEEGKPPLEGAVFALYEALPNGDGTYRKDMTAPVITAMSNAEGYAVFENLMLGKPYLAEEVQAPDGYEIAQSSQNILLTAVPEGSDAVTEVINDTIKIQIEVIKTDKETKEALAGAEFWVRDETGRVIAILKTDETGRAVSKKLKKWDATKPHTIEEGVAPEGYELPVGGKKQTIVLEEGKSLYTFSYEDIKIAGTIRIHKSSADPGSLALYPLTGTKFAVKRAGTDELVDTLVIGEDGYSQESKPLLAGTYAITEIAAADGYYLDADGDGIPDAVGFEKTVEITTAETMTVEYTNAPVTGRLEIHKVDSKEGTRAVGGVSFALYRDDGSEDGVYLETLETDENGIAFSSQTLYQGSYYVIETKAPPNYWIDPTPRPFVIDKTNMGVIKRIIANDLVELNIRVHKMDDKKKNLMGAGFTLYRADGTKVAFSQQDESGNAKEVTEFFTDAEGMLLFPQKVGYGAYTLKETTTPPKYKKAEDIAIVIDSSTKYVEIEAIGKTVACEVINYPKIASLLITKVDKNGKVPLSGVEFLLRCEENGYEQTFLTDANGKIHVTGLEAGEYTYTETKPKDGYLGTTPEGKPIAGTITVSEDGKEYQVVVENRKEEHPGRLQIRKCDEETKAPLPGAVFSLRDADGALISTQTTDSQGYAVFPGLMPGNTYKAEEVSAPPGYDLPKEAVKPFAIKEGETKELIFLDQKTKTERGRLSIIKEGSDGEALAGALFSITNEAAGYRAQLETGADGRIVLTDLAWGEYRIEEILPPAGYQRSEHPVKTIVLLKGENFVTLTFVNEKTPEPENPGRLGLRKVDAETGKALAGALFCILDENKEEVLRGITGEDGRIEWKLPAGTYYYQEIQAPEGYEVDMAFYPVSVEEGKVAAVEVKNRKKPVDGQLLINKVDAFSGVPIPHCTFVILNEQKKEILRDVTDADGICEFTLPPGAYYYQELKAAPGYVLDSKPYRFDITPDNRILHATMKNTKEGKGELALIKRDKDSNRPLAGCQFLLTDEQGKERFRGVTDQNGTCVFDLEAGTYWYQEIKAPEGYVLDASRHKVTISYSGQRVSITVYNQLPPPETGSGLLQIIKLDDETGTGLHGAVFAVTDMSGTLLATKTTNENGTVVFELPYGVYDWEERKAPDGYLLEAGKHRVAITREAVLQSVTKTNRKAPLAPPPLVLPTPTPQTPAPPTLSPPTPAPTNPGPEPTVPPKEKPGTLILTKVEEENNSRIPNTLITVRTLDGTVIGQKRTDANGEALFSLPVGQYTYEETEAAPGYRLDDTAHAFAIKGAGETVQEVLTNEKLSELWLLKVDYHSKKRIPGCRLAVFDTNGTKVAEGVTDGEGLFKVSLPAGEYLYQEVEAAPGYLLEDTRRQITVTKGKPNQVTITNVKQTISLPKTGDAAGQGTRPKQWPVIPLGIAFLCLAGLVGCLMYWKKK